MTAIVSCTARTSATNASATSGGAAASCRSMSASSASVSACSAYGVARAIRSGVSWFGHREPQTLAQAADGVAHPRLDGREVGRQPLRDLDVGQPVVVGELDAFPLHVGQRTQAVGDLLAFVAQDDRVGDVVGRRIDVGGPVAGLALAGRLLGAHPVHRAPVRHRHQPRQRRARRSGRSWPRSAIPAGRRPAWSPRCSRDRAARG